MGLIDDQGVVLVEKAVLLDFIEQHAVGEHLDKAGLADLLGKTYLETHSTAQRAVELFCHPAGHGPSRQPPWLGVADGALNAPTQLQADFRQLGGLAGAGFPGDHHHLMVTNGRLDLLSAGHHWQVRPVQHGLGRLTFFPIGNGSGNGLGNLLHGLVIALVSRQS